MKPSREIPENPPAIPFAVAKTRPTRALTWALGKAVLCTLLMFEAVVTALGGRANGDMMVIVCPILGAVFLSIPAVQAWWECLSILKAIL